MEGSRVIGNGRLHILAPFIPMTEMHKPLNRKPRACLNGSQSFHSQLQQNYLISVANDSSPILIDSENINLLAPELFF